VVAHHIARWLRDEEAAIRGTRRRDVQSACDSERPTTVTHGQSWSLDGCGQESAQLASALVRGLDTSPKLVVRGRVELPTFRFSGCRVTYLAGSVSCRIPAGSLLSHVLGERRADVFHAIPFGQLSDRIGAGSPVGQQHRGLTEV
jgi:hypothetical protein